MSQKYLLGANAPGRAAVLAKAHQFLDRLPPGKSWRIEIKEARKERSCPQNASLWGVAYACLAEVTGYTPEELHNEFCGRFFGWKVVDVFGERRRRPIRTTTTDQNGERDVISTLEFSRFYDLIQQVGAEAGIDVPSPDPFHGDPRWSHAA